jgi:hypothetical protein
MKKIVVAVFGAIGLMAGNLGAQVADLDGLNYWGTGTNRAAFVVYWNDSKSPDALAWGYRWSNPGETVADMLLFMTANDPRLFARIDSSATYGLALFGLGHQTGSPAFGVTGAQDANGDPVTPAFVNGINDLNTIPLTTEAPPSSAGAAPSNASDRYAEGWNDNGFWELYHSGTDNFALQSSFALPTTWTASWVGSSVVLVDGAWAAFSISDPDFASNPPTAGVQAAIPEPSSLLLTGLGALAFLFLRKRA